MLVPGCHSRPSGGAVAAALVAPLASALGSSATRAARAADSSDVSTADCSPEVMDMAHLRRRSRRRHLRSKRARALAERIIADAWPLLRRVGLPLLLLAPASVTVLAGLALKDLKATAHGQAIVITWETAYEIDMLGFHIQRATEQHGSYARISGIIPAIGGMVGADYEYTDANVTPGVTYWYRLEAMETSGYIEYYGPVSAATAPLATDVLINEVDADTPDTDVLEFVELYDGGTGSTALDGLVVVLFNGSSDTSYSAFDLDGYATDANGTFVLGNAGVTGVDLVFAGSLLQNGADAVALYAGDGTDFPGGSAITATGLLDALVYDTDDDEDAGLLALLNPGQPQVNEAGGGDTTGHANQRCPNGAGGQRNTSSYNQASPTPGAANDCGTDLGPCGGPATLIHAVQGSGLTSPLSGTADVIIEGIVAGDFQHTDLRGFFVQEEHGDMDGDASTSEGIFVYGDGVAVRLGELVRVKGDVREYYGMTELTGVGTDVVTCTSGVTLTPSSLTLPLPSDTYLERVEGMLVWLTQTLSVTENYNLGRFGEVILSSGGRLMNPGNVVSPGAAANAVQAANDLNRIILDDGSTQRNPEPIIHPSPELSATNTLRAGDSVSTIFGVLSYGWSGWSGTDSYRVHPIAAPMYVDTNPRPAAPPGVGGTLRVASFNVLNYFNGDGLGGGFPTSRGADTLSEFDRQRAKIISAIVALEADVIGLIEIENDGYGPYSAIQDLVDGLNGAAPGGTTYDFVEPGFVLGLDEIKVGLLYRTETVSLTGSAATTDSVPFDRYRLPLAQTFEQRATGERFTAAVSHFKSKGCGGASGADADLGDGQGCYNATRTEMATILSNWLATDPTASGDPDFLIIGDLNAYAMEDPITTLEGAGYTDLLERYVGPDAYSYVFAGQSGTLDHALANTSIVTQVTGATVWHTNADEPRVLDYNEEFKSAGQLASLYAGDAYRASDHDAIVVGLDLGNLLQVRALLPMALRGK